MKLIIKVFLPSPLEDALREDINNWDKLGASEELDYSLGFFDEEYFDKPTGRVASSSDNRVYWQVNEATADQKFSILPAIQFYDVETKMTVLEIVGTPQSRGIVRERLYPLLIADTPSLTPAKLQAGLGILAFLFLLFKIKKTA